MTFEKRLDILTHNWPVPLRMLIVSTKAFLFHHGTIRAAAMTYTSFLAVIPFFILLTAISLSLGLGSFFNTYLPVLDQFFALGLPLDDIMPLLENTEHIHLRTLGVVGSVSLFITYLFAIGNLETNMNVVWENQMSRPFVKQFAAYTPLLLLAALGFAFFAMFVNHLKSGLLHIASNTELLTAETVPQVMTTFWTITVNVVFIALIFFTIFLLPYRKHHQSYRKLFWPSLLVSVAIWVCTCGYLFILIVLQKSLVTRMSLFYGSLAFIPLVLLFAFGFWAIMLYGNCLVWTISSWPKSGIKKWNWVQPEGYM